MIKDKKYHRDNSKKNYERNKELRKRYQSGESEPGTTFSEFKRTVLGSNKKKSPSF